MRCRNSSVLARSSASESSFISGSSALMARTFGISDLTTRSFLVPKTLPNRVLIKRKVLERAARPTYILSLAYWMPTAEDRPGAGYALLRHVGDALIFAVIFPSTHAHFL